ncbi:MAG: hypothetical protein MUF36_04010 [Bacteroidales bacterium]|jgi:hypothetical protein|nr:hypothetical protein [Bacteroidales bacterium]
MKSYTTGKILVVLSILAAMIFYNSCDKQEKCGCDGDILFSVDSLVLDYSSFYILSEGGSISFQLGYDTYVFCNPVQMYQEYLKIDQGTRIILYGDVYWDCNYITQSSQSSYYNYYKYYNIDVTRMKPLDYGK